MENESVQHTSGNADLKRPPTLSQVRQGCQECRDVRIVICALNSGPLHLRPLGYEADALRAARRRIALAGYRLTEEPTRLFAENWSL